jgi:hypothetical protein
MDKKLYMVNISVEGLQSKGSLGPSEGLMMMIKGIRMMRPKRMTSMMIWMTSRTLWRKIKKENNAKTQFSLKGSDQSGGSKVVHMCL